MRLYTALLMSDNNPLRVNWSDGARLVTVQRNQYVGMPLENGQHFDFTASTTVLGDDGKPTGTPTAHSVATLDELSDYLYDAFGIGYTSQQWVPVNVNTMPYLDGWGNMGLARWTDLRDHS